MKTNFIKKAGAFAALVMLLVSVNSFGQLRVKTFLDSGGSGGYQRVETNCMCGARKVGTANDCGPGPGACIDTDCSGVSC